MDRHDRRGFLRTALAGVAAGTAGGLAKPAAAAAAPAGVDRRPLGATGAEVGILGCGLGSQFVAPYQRAEEADKPKAAEDRQALLLKALEQGCNYWDTANQYGPSQTIIGPALEQVRDQVFIVSKTGARDYDGYMRELEKSLRELKTDHLDLFHCHDMQPRNVTAEGLKQMEEGCVRAARKAKEDGSIRHWGVTGHSSAACLVTFIEAFEPEAVMSVFAAGHQDQSYVETLLPAARAKNMAIIAMKTHRQAGQTDLAGAELIRYALSLAGIAVANVGMDTLEHLTANVQVASAFRALDGTQIAAIDRHVGRQLEGVEAIWTRPQYRDAVV